jgi:hypothetical protein
MKLGPGFCGGISASKGLDRSFSMVQASDVVPLWNIPILSAAANEDRAMR